jgi:hypothetical protein
MNKVLAEAINTVSTPYVSTRRPSFLLLVLVLPVQDREEIGGA